MRLAKTDIAKMALIGATAVVLVSQVAGNSASTATLRDGEVFSPVSIQSGDLRIASTGSAQWIDQSGNIVTAAIPGETVYVSQGVDIDASGDNMQVSLSVSPIGADGAKSSLPPDFVATYQLLNENGFEVTDKRPLGSKSNIDIPSSGSGEVDFYVKVEVTYPANSASDTQAPSFVTSVAQEH